MTTTTRNEAAEQDVQDWRNSLLAAWHDDPDERTFKRYMDGFEGAVRRATVERIRQAFRDYDQSKGTPWKGWIDRILDEEAAR